MDSEDDNIFYSSDNLNNLIESSGLNPKAAIEKYLREVVYPPISDFNAGLEWFNVSEPISFEKHLRGKIVVLDFFTYCCINCMHILPDLKALESRFSVEDGVVVVGVHSAKFENEKLSANIQSAVQRYNITHPVVNDATCDMWRKCEVHCWPTLLILGPAANPLLMMMGEGHRERLIQFVEEALKFYKDKDVISDHSLPIKHNSHIGDGVLAFPGKVAMFGNLLGVSDSGNNRVLIVDDGVVVKVIGSGLEGGIDGSLESAEFNHPQGLVFASKDVLYIADTENHAIRKIDLLNNEVTTIAGNGKQGNDQLGGKIGIGQEISSPWDLTIYKNNVLIIAMAGTHQIWAIFLTDTKWWKDKEYKAGTVVCIAGSGKEENRNNQYPNNAAFAQPSGLALVESTDEVFIADSESSSVRKLCLVTGKVSAVVGGERNPNNLFAFGDKDGTLFDAKLQHCLGLAASKDEKFIYVADTYNHKIKSIDVSTNSVTTIKLPGELKEPSGLCFDSTGTKLYIADTNNHRIKIITLENNKITKLETLELTLQQETTQVDSNKKIIEAPNKLELSANGGKITLKVSLLFTGGLELTDGAPNKWKCILPSKSWNCVPNAGVADKFMEIVIMAPGEKGEKFIDLPFDLVTCRNDTCLPKHFTIRQFVIFGSSGANATVGSLSINVDFKDVFVR